MMKRRRFENLSLSRSKYGTITEEALIFFSSKRFRENKKKKFRVNECYGPTSSWSCFVSLPEKTVGCRF
jgi:hypothetical protein